VTTALAEYLLSAQCGLKAGDRVLLVFFPGLHFTASLIACFKSGIIAVPVFPPDPTRLKKDLHHFVSIQSSSGANVVLTHSAYGYAKKVAGVTSIFSSKGERWPDMRWLLVDDVLGKAKAKKGPPAPQSLPSVRRE
jgi:acyl-CoA synthetase (AMP-forming)/AMP-acid ligase II